MKSRDDARVQAILWIEADSADKDFVTNQVVGQGSGNLATAGTATIGKENLLARGEVLASARGLDAFGGLAFGEDGEEVSHLRRVGQLCNDIVEDGIDGRSIAGCTVEPVKVLADNGK